MDQACSFLAGFGKVSECTCNTRNTYCTSRLCTHKVVTKAIIQYCDPSDLTYSIFFIVFTLNNESMVVAGNKPLII